jgi:hypothetical protein
MPPRRWRSPGAGTQKGRSRCLCPKPEEKSVEEFLRTHGCQGSIDVGDQISAETGQMNGPTCTGVADRVGTELPANGALQDLLMLPGWQRFVTDFTDVNRIRKQRVECSA